MADFAYEIERIPVPGKAEYQRDPEQRRRERHQTPAADLAYLHAALRPPRTRRRSVAQSCEDPKSRSPAEERVRNPRARGRRPAESTRRRDGDIAPPGGASPEFAD